jgi:hypothetical protein
VCDSPLPKNTTKLTVEYCSWGIAEFISMFSSRGLGEQTIADEASALAIGNSENLPYSVCIPGAHPGTVLPVSRH